MRILIILRASDDVMLPVSYNYLVQASIYNNISHRLSKFLHDKGFVYGKRRFKFFTFSRLMGEYRVERGMIHFNGDVGLYVSSPIKRFINDLAHSVLRRGHLRFGVHDFEVVGITVPNQPNIGNEVVVRMLSPVTVYSTLFTPDGRKKTYYYSPFEIEFQQLINANIKKKYHVFFHKDLKSSFKIEPVKVRETIVTYKNFLIKGWMGMFKLQGSKRAIQLAYDTGIGSKNSQGFGMFEIISH
jgi:CRISPR-associated endoribonuclease Cas6